MLTCLSQILADLGGSLAVASKGLFSTGVSTDLSGAFIPSRSWSTATFANSSADSVVK